MNGEKKWRNGRGGVRGPGLFRALCNELVKLETMQSCCKCDGWCFTNRRICEVESFDGN